MAGREWDPTHRYETSWLLSPWLLFSCRAVVSLFIFSTRLSSLGFDCAHSTLAGAPYGCTAADHEFSYFTTLTNWGQAFYFAFAALHTASYALRGRALLDAWPRPLQHLHAVLFTTVTVYPYIVTAVYWAVLYHGPAGWHRFAFLTFRDTAQHALNSVWALAEIVLTRAPPPPWWHAAALVAIAGLYVGLAYLTRLTDGFYVYSFLDPAEGGPGRVAGYVFGILAACLVVLVLVIGVSALRRWLTEEKLGMRGKFSPKDRGAGGGATGSQPRAGAGVGRVGTHDVELVGQRR